MQKRFSTAPVVRGRTVPAIGALLRTVASLFLIAPGCFFMNGHGAGVPQVVVASWLPLIPPAGWANVGWGTLTACLVGLIFHLFRQYRNVSTQFREAVLKHEDQKRFMTAVLDNAQVAIVACDEAGQLTIFNKVAREVHGIAKQPIRPEEWAEHYDLCDGEGELLSIEQVPLFRAWKGESVKNVELVVAREGRPPRLLVTCGEPILDEAGRAMGAVTVMQDVTSVTETREHYRRILETANDAFIEADVRGYITEWNKRSEQIFGWSRAEVVGKNLVDTIIPEPSRAAHRRGMVRLLQSPQPQEANRRVELAAIDRLGREFPIELTAWALDGSGGLKFNAFIRDISERKRADQLLDRSEEFNRLVLESSPDCINVLSLTGHLLSISSSGCRAMEIEKAGEFLGRWWPEFWQADARQAAAAALDRAIAGGEGSFRGFCPTAKGTPKWWDVRITAIRNTGSGSTRLLAISRDITIERLSQEALRVSEAKLREAQDIAHLGYWEIDVTNHEVMWSDEMFRIFSVAKEQGINYQKYQSLLEPEDRERFFAAVENAVSCGQPFHLTQGLILNDELIRHVECRGRIEYGPQGHPLKLSGTALDVTSQIEGVLALQRAREDLEVRVAERTAALTMEVRHRRQSEEELRQTERHLGVALGFSGVVTWSWHPKRDSVVWVGPIEKVFARGASELNTFNALKAIIHPDDQEEIVQKMEDSCLRDIEYEAEFRIVLPNAGIRWIAGRGRPSFVDGELMYVSGVNFDITPQKLSDRQLAASEQRFRQLADAMPQIVWTATSDGTVDYFNQRWFDYTGMTMEESQGWGWASVLHRDDSQACIDTWAQAAKTGALYDLECRVWDRTSQTYRWHLCRAFPTRNGKGAISRWFGTSTDIEDHKRAQMEILALNRGLEARVAERTAELSRANEELTRTQGSLQAVLDSATQVSIIAIDNDGIIKLFNAGAERLLGYSSEQLVSQSTPLIFNVPEHCAFRARQLSTELGREILADDVFSMMNLSSTPLAVESTYVHRNGERIDVSLAITPMVDPNGTRIGTLCIAADIRGRKTLERQLSSNILELQQQTRRAEEANRAKSEFLAAMSHELRTPMNAILGMADLLWDSNLDPTQRQFVEVFRRAGANLLTLLNDILDLSKIESGHFTLEQIDFDLEELVERTVEIILPKAHAKRIGLISRVAPGTLSSLNGDPTRLQQILLNLLGNAVKFTEQGEITLTIEGDRCNANRLHFKVTDTGIGIPSDKVESIFADFEQAESSTTRRFGGTGLGLGIARRLVSRMAGHLHVESEVGNGSTFYFDASFCQSAKKLRRPELVSGLVDRRVLIIDNNATNRLIFAEACAAWGMVTSDYSDPAMALAAARTAAQSDAPFDLIILDRLMPLMDGFELVSQLRKASVTAALIMTTSDSVPGDQTRGSQLGIAGYAVKPVRRSELLRLICSALATGDSQEPSSIVGSGTENIAYTRGGRILIAEDSEDNRFLMQAYMKGTLYEISFAENGERAVGMARTERFNLILMDIQMPVMDGLTATKLIRKTEKEQGKLPVPVLALTANARTEDAHASREAGCNSHLSKPISKSKLLSAIKQYIPEGGESAMAKPLSIELPLGLEEAAKRYLHSRKDEVPRLIQLANQNAFEQIQSLSHNMKGTGTSYGFPDVTRLGALMEDAAKAKDAALFLEQLLELSKYLEEASQAVGLVTR